MQGAEGSPDVASANEAPHWMIRKTYLQWGRPGHWDMQLVTYTSDVESLYRVSQHWFASAPRGFMYLHRRVLRKLICFLSNLHVYRTQFLMDLFKDPILSCVCVRVRVCVCVCILRVRVCLFVCLSVCLSVVFVLFVLFVLFVFVSFFVCWFGCCLSIYLSVCLSAFLPVCLDCLFVWMLVCLLVGWLVGLLVCETRYVSCGKEPFKNNFWNHSKSQQGVVAGSRAYHQRRHPGFPGDAWLDQPCVPARLLWSPVTNLMLFQVFVRFECKPLLGSYITARVDSSVTFRRQLFEHSKGPLQSKLLTVSSVCGCVCVFVCMCLCDSEELDWQSILPPWWIVLRFV